MEINSFDQLTERVMATGRVFRVAVGAAGDPHTLEAAMIAKDKGVISPVLVGDKERIDAILDEMGESVPEEDIIDIPDAAEAAAYAVKLVHDGKADFLMKGKLDTSVLLKAVVNKEYGLGTGALMSIIVLAEIPGYHKLVAVVDGGMIPYPTLEQKKGIIENTVGAMRALGYERPKVGVLAAIEKVNPKMPETVEARELREMNERGEIKDCIVEGPVSYDCAMNKEISEIKGFDSEVSGDCDILIAPNIHAANIMTKVLAVTCHARTAGFILGAKCPIVMSSRGSSPEEKFLSNVLAASVVIGKEKMKEEE